MWPELPGTYPDKNPDWLTRVSSENGVSLLNRRLEITHVVCCTNHSYFLAMAIGPVGDLCTKPCTHVVNEQYLKENITYKAVNPKVP